MYLLRTCRGVGGEEGRMANRDNAEDLLERQEVCLFWFDVDEILESVGKFLAVIGWEMGVGSTSTSNKYTHNTHEYIVSELFSRARAAPGTSHPFASREVFYSRKETAGV